MPGAYINGFCSLRLCRDARSLVLASLALRLCVRGLPKRGNRQGANVRFMSDRLRQRSKVLLLNSIGSRENIDHQHASSSSTAKRYLVSVFLWLYLSDQQLGLLFKVSLEDRVLQCSVIGPCSYPGMSPTPTQFSRRGKLWGKIPCFQL